MEKLVGIFVNKNLLRWQAESILAIEKESYKIILFVLPAVKRKSDKWLDMLFFLEQKILKSPNKYLAIVLDNDEPKRETYSLQKANDILLLPLNFKNFEYLISLASIEDEILINISTELPPTILQLATSIGGEIEENIVQSYKNGETVIDIDLHQFEAGIKTKIYTTCNSIEAGLLLRTVNSILAKCSLLIQRFLNGGSNINNLILDKRTSSTLNYKTKKRNLLSSFFYHLFDKVYYKRQWILLYQFTDNPEISGINSYSTILPPKGKFWADFFPIFYKNEHYIFFEELEYKNHKGYLSYLKLKDGVVEGPYKVIEEKHHLSFPNIIELNGELYMIPETIAAKSIQLWKCENFPDKWVFEKNLIENISAVDTVIEKIDNKWWLFCTEKPLPNASGHEELCIYFSDNPITGSWKPHPKNPVLSDARMGRNAGKIENINNKLIRYGQFSGDTYGKALTKSEIILISETEYKEEFKEVIFPDVKKGFHNFHTFNYTKGLAVSDALRRIRRF